MPLIVAISAKNNLNIGTFPTAHCCTPPEATQASLPQVTAKSRFSGKDKGTAGTRINPTLPAVPLSMGNGTHHSSSSKESSSTCLFIALQSIVSFKLIISTIE